MANHEHLDLLKQGVETWNKWREEHPEIRPDLKRANLTKANLSGANLKEANLQRADLGTSDLSGADLSGANLIYAILADADLSGANLSDADLGDTDLDGADFSRADLSRATLIAATLREANLSGANLSEAHLGAANFNETILDRADFSKASVRRTIFADIDLRMVKGLETVEHRASSTIGINTILLSEGDISEKFLRGAGVSDTFITYIRSLVGKAIEYYSCFISYSSKDQAFAARLYADLQSNNVRCWFAPENLKWGEKIRTGIDEAIRLHDKLLLILSKHSVASGWVEREVKTALSREKKEKRTVLFPVRVDRAVFDCPFEWATEIRHERNIGDFTRWKNHDDYQKAFNRLLHDLKAESK